MNRKFDFLGWVFVQTPEQGASTRKIYHAINISGQFRRGCFKRFRMASSILNILLSRAQLFPGNSPGSVWEYRSQGHDIHRKCHPVGCPDPSNAARFGILICSAVRSPISSKTVVYVTCAASMNMQVDSISRNTNYFWSQTGIPARAITVIPLVPPRYQWSCFPRFFTSIPIPSEAANGFMNQLNFFGARLFRAIANGSFFPLQ